MIKTMLVDDDVEMLDWLEKIIDWGKFGYSISAIARNGTAALAMCREEVPDLIITDITMPGMDGVELINEVQKLKPDIKCIFLTCHEDFNYALKAVKLQVEDYVLKYTLTQNSLSELLCKFSRTFLAENSKYDEVYLLNRELSSSKIILEEKFFTDISENISLSKENILERAKALKIKLVDGPFRVICTYVDNYEKSMERSTAKENYLFKAHVLKLAEEILQNENIKYFALGKGIYAALYWDGDSYFAVKKNLEEKLKQFHASVFEALNVPVSSCIGSSYMLYGDIGKALDENKQLRDSYFYDGSGFIISERKTYSTEDGNSLLEEFTADFILALNKSDRVLINQTLEWLYNKLQKSNYSPACVKRIYNNIKMQMELTALKKGKDIGTAMADPDTFMAVKENLSEMIESYLVLSAMNPPVTSRREISAVLRYIDTNISERITCESMAAMVNMNSSYFSRLFKNETGVNFSDYLINKRIEKATLLLKTTNIKIEEITKAVGLEQPSYFYKLYRKVTGKTPGEVRGT